MAAASSAHPIYRGQVGTLALSAQLTGGGLAYRAPRGTARLAVPIVVPVAYLTLLAERLVARRADLTVGAAGEGQDWVLFDPADLEDALPVNEGVGELALGAVLALGWLAHLRGDKKNMYAL